MPLVPEAIQAVPPLTSAACGQNLDCPGPAVSGLRAPNLAVPAPTEPFLPGHHPYAVPLACTDRLHDP